MHYYSTNNKHLRVTFEDAVFGSLPPDNGLYMPLEIPRLDPMFFRHLPAMKLADIGETVIRPFCDPDVSDADLRRIVSEAFDFPAPVRPLDPGLAVLELFHGPTLAFKDFGARFMSRVMGHFSRERAGVLDVLVATSGDTGGAVASGFLGVAGTRVTILFPKGKVSPIQELQLTAHAQNVFAIEIDGTFDDCQALVKQAFLDPELDGALQLTSANSINISRLLPQMVYYFYAYGQMLAQGIREVVWVVPSGNFGNIAAGLLAHKMGLPAHRFVAATNVNDSVPRFLASGQFEPRPSIPTLSNAMDVGTPSNWVRIMDLFRGDRDALVQKLTAMSFTDVQTRGAIQNLYDRYGYLACPHSAIGWLAAEAYRAQDPGEYGTVFLATAHPCKFTSVFPSDLAEKITMPDTVQNLAAQRLHKLPIKADFSALKDYLLKRARD